MARRTNTVVAPPKPRRAKPGATRMPRWHGGVSAQGELVLRRVEGKHEDYARVQDSFSQGLAFVARRWRNVMNDALLMAGQNHLRWGTLYWIAVFGDRVNQAQLAQRMGIEQPTLARVLRELEAEGIIRRRASRADRRARIIELTPASQPLMKRINQIQSSIRDELTRGLGHAELSACLTAFARILKNADQVAAKWRVN